MDLIFFAVALLILIVIIPVLLATITLKLYLSVLVLAVLVWVGYLWLVENIAPSESESRTRSELGLCRVYPSVEAVSHREDTHKQITSVIFVHGLGANPTTAWNSGKTCWITDFLPDDLKESGLDSTVRLFTFGYRSFWLRKSNLRLRETANALLQELLSDELKEDDLVLVSHSFGGLVVKKALVTRPELKNRVKGLIFLGTPHQGTHFSRYGLVLSYLLAPLDSDIDIMRILGPESAELNDLQKDFNDYFKKCLAKHFFEKWKTTRLLFGFIPWLQEYLVTEQSATYGASSLDGIGLDADHRGLNRFSERNNSNYKLVFREFIKILQKESEAPFKRSPWQEELREFLKGNFQITQEAISTYVDSKTCDWLYKHKQYKIWIKESRPCIMWLTGPPGCGKSVLFRHIIRHTFQELLPTTQRILEFACNSQYEKTRTPMNIASALLWQLTEILPRFVDDAKRSPGLGSMETVSFQRFSLEEICSLIYRTLEKLDGSVTVILAIDALDECRFPPGEDPFLRLIEQLVSFGKSEQQPPLKLIFTTRNNAYEDITRRYSGLKTREACSSFPVIEVANENSVGIELYVKRQLATWAGGNAEKEASRLDREKKIIQRSNGVFLWAVIVIENLFQAGSSEAELDEALQDLPSDNNLFNLIRQIVLKIPKNNIERARDMILFTINSRRTLTISELAALLAIRKSRHVEDMAKNVSADMKRDVQTICRSLLFCSEGFVRPFHETIRNFFHAASCPEAFRISETDAHAIFAEVCIKSLRFLSLPSVDTSTPAEPLRYTADNFLYHTTLASEAQQRILATPIRAFLWSNKRFTSWFRFIYTRGESFQALLQLMQLKNSSYKQDIKLKMPEGVTPIHVLALFVSNENLFSAIVFQDTNWDWFSLHDVDGEGRNAIHWAAGQEDDNQERSISYNESGSDDIISSLVERGLDPKAQAINGRNPVHIVVQGGRQQNFHALIKQKVDVNVKDKAQLTPLHLSTFFSRSIELLRLLVSASAIIDAPAEDQWTPLHFAAQSGHKEVIEALMAAQATVNAQTKKGYTPLHLAALTGHKGAIESLVAAGATVDAQTKKGYTPLHFAALTGHKEAIESLVAAEVTIDAQGKDQWTPLHLAALNGHKEGIEALVTAGAAIDAQGKGQWTPLHLAAQNGNKEVIEALVAAQATIDAQGKDQWTPLHLAALNGHKQDIEALVAAGATIDAQGKDQWMPLHLAAQNGNKEVIEALVAAGATIDAQEKDQWTPLHLAAHSGHEEAIEALVAAGAIVDAQTDGGFTPLHNAARYGHRKVIEALVAAQATVDAQEKDQLTPLHFAALNGHKEAIKALVAAGAIVDAQGEDQLTPLHVAACSDHKEAIEALVAAGAFVDAQTDGGSTPLHHAARYGHRKVIEALVAAQATVDAQEKDQLTPLHFAALNGHKEAIEALVAAGATIDAQTKERATPLDLAVQNGHEKVSHCLIEIMASSNAKTAI